MVASLIIILLAEIAYYAIASYFRIGAPVTPRSSHRTFTATGGGVAVVVAVVCYWVGWSPQVTSEEELMLAGGLLLGVVSYCDDLSNLSPKLRLFIHAIVVGGVYYQCLVGGHYDYFLLLMIFGVGIVNAFNFMDGINGMLAGYGAVVLATLICVLSVLGSPMVTLLSLILASLLIFAFFNFRTRALLFSGDVGAITVGFFVFCGLAQAIMTTYNVSMIVFVAVFIVDTLFTIIQRLFAGEHILEPHRRHLYQSLTLRRHVPQLYVSSAYALLQAVINVLWFVIPVGLRLSYAIIVFGALTCVYFYLKRLPRINNLRA